MEDSGSSARERHLTGNPVPCLEPRSVFARPKVLGACLFFGLLVLWTANRPAAPAHASALRQSAPAAVNPIDVIVILDDSGSMATCWPWALGAQPSGPPCEGFSHNAPSDPGELRYSAARLLVHLADGADRIAVLRFDSAAGGVGALGLLQEVGTVENRRRLAASLQAPQDYADRGYTRLDLGLREALRLLKDHGDPDRNQYIVLLTDGEPSAPLNVTGQRQVITNLLTQIQEAGGLLFPVILCNPDAGCSGEILKERSPLAREAKSAQDLLLIFSELFSEMKPDRSVVTHRNVDGDLSLSVRKAHGTGGIAFVSPSSTISVVERDGAPMQTQSVLDDANVDLNLVAAPLPAGEWVAQTTDLSAFAVVQADSFPELLFPPPSVHRNPASIRYYPVGRSPLIMLAGAGPAAAEPLLLNGTTQIPVLGQDPLSGRAVALHQLSGSPDHVTVQLGEDSHPLQLRRTFRLQARDDLPQARVVSPRPDGGGILEDGSLQLQVGFDLDASVRDVEVAAYVSDITGSEDRVVYREKLSCLDGTGASSAAAAYATLCSDSGFAPQDGRDYEVLYLIAATVKGLRFGSFARAALEMEPAIYVRGLPADIDLAKMPEGGWPLTVQAGTVEEIGALEASLILRRSDTSEIVREVSLDFSVDVPESGSQAGLLRVEGLDLLRPGEYEGQLNLSALSPAGLPMQVDVRPAPSLSVLLSIPRSQARIRAQEADFGELLFDTSPNYRLDEEILLPVDFSLDVPFRLSVELTESSCGGLTATAGDLQPFPSSSGSGAAARPASSSEWALPVRLQSRSPMSPGACQGILGIAGPDQDFEVVSSNPRASSEAVSHSASLPFRFQVREVEWSIAGALDFGNLGRAGESGTETLQLRFNGKTPFVLNVVGIAASAEFGEGTVALDHESLESAPVEITGAPDDEGFYHVPVTLVARKALPSDPLHGSFYSGGLMLSIAGLDDEVRTVDISFRSPTLYQRHVEWWLRPFYTFPLVLCSGPLFLLGLLILVARFRGRNYRYDDEEDSVAVLPEQGAAAAPAFAAGPRSADSWQPSVAVRPASPSHSSEAWADPNVSGGVLGQGEAAAGSWEANWEHNVWSEPTASDGAAGEGRSWGSGPASAGDSGDSDATDSPWSSQYSY